MFWSLVEDVVDVGCREMLLERDGGVRVLWMGGDLSWKFK